MATRPFKEQSDKFVQKVKDLTSKRSRGIEPPEQYRKNLDTLLTQVADYLDEVGGDTSHLRNIDTAPDGAPWVRRLGILKNDYYGVHNHMTQISDEENSIYRIERKSQFIALIFRFFTTVMIGVGVMFVYWWAGKLEIAMPLMRIGM
ncbi:MAG: hypothetical protein DHS20C12_06080 [Pseudohongiella sp.]|nr:MAG: hypothetical protein DHS20C12_06080 [Pseudohongiella sp.]